MHRLEKMADQVSPGGYKCVCCGPSPSKRKEFRRLRRRRIKNMIRKEVDGQLRDVQ